MKLLTDCRALVTGSSRGIGAGIAIELAQHGAEVIVNFLHRAEDAQLIVNRIVSFGGKARLACFDVSNSAQVREAIMDVTSAGGPISVLVNNAGIIRDRTLRKMTDDDWHAVIGVNLTGVRNTCAVVVPDMIRARYGRVVNISSFVALAGNFGQTNYAAAKAGIIGFTRALALEVAKYGVTVNAVCPGFIETEMWASMPPNIQQLTLERIPVGRIGTVGEIAAVVRFLAEEGDYITGQSINVNGGIYFG